MLADGNRGPQAGVQAAQPNGSGADAGSNPAPGRGNVLGVAVSAINMDRALQTIGGWIDRRERHYVCVTGVHGVMESQDSDELRRIHNAAGLVTPDGMPLAWLLRLAGHAATDRVCGPELMPAVVAASQGRGDRHFLYGATPETLERLRANLLADAPQARIVGTYSPPWPPSARPARTSSGSGSARPSRSAGWRATGSGWKRRC